MHHVFFTQPWQVYTAGGVILALLVLAVASAFWFDVQSFRNKARRTRAHIYNRQQARKRSEEEQYWRDHCV